MVFRFATFTFIVSAQQSVYRSEVKYFKMEKVETKVLQEQSTKYQWLAAIIGRHNIIQIVNN